LYLLIYFPGPDYQAELGKLEAAGRTKDNTIQELIKRIEELVEEQQLQGHCKIGDWTDYSMIKDLEQEIEEGLTERLGLEQTVTILKVVDDTRTRDRGGINRETRIGADCYHTEGSR